MSRFFIDSRTVIVDTGPPPKPDDTDPSVDFGKLTTDVAALAKDFPADQRETVRSVYASAAEATHATIKDRAEATSKALETGLGLNAYDDWYSFRFGLAKSLSALKAAGTLTESNHAECWAAIAEGLKRSSTIDY